jgi:hypothetical protein
MDRRLRKMAERMPESGDRTTQARATDAYTAHTRAQRTRPRTRMRVRTHWHSASCTESEI